MDTKQAVGGTGTLVGICASIFLQVHPLWAEQHPLSVEGLYMLTGCFLIFTVLQFGWVQRKLGQQSIGKQSLPGEAPTKSELSVSGTLNPTATATVGNITVINNKVDSDEIAEAVAKKLEEGQLTLSPGDGFVQLEDGKFNLQVPSVPLQPGQTFSLKYFYANRGGLPVYDVQTWGLMHILPVELNPAEHLNSVMLDGVKNGHEKFPNAGSTLGVGIEFHNIAVLTEPLTEKHIRAVRQGVCALIFMVGGVWKDNRNHFHYWVEGRKAELPNFPDLAPFRWKAI